MTADLNSQDIIFALDIGTRTVIGTAGIVKNKKFNVISEYCIEHKDRAMVDGQIHDIQLVSNTVNEVKQKIEEDLNMKMEKVVIAAAGRFLRTVISKEDMEIDYDSEIDKDTIRSLELTAVKSAEDIVNKDTDGRLYCVGYSVQNYYLNGYLIGNLLSQKGENISVEVIATFLPRSVVDSLYSVMEKVDLQVISLTLEPIAAMEAAVPQKLRLLNLALVDVGAGTSDIAISSNNTISAYGMVSKAGDEVTEIIAKNYLVDFDTAEIIKKQCSLEKNIKYEDVIGIENEISGEEVIQLISPVVKKISDEISSKIISLNGDKPPNAVFLVGGGAHTPKLQEFLSKNLNLSMQRIAIKGRNSVSDCVCMDNSLESTGVTVLGIALVSIRKLGHDFIDVILNDTIISLFNSHRHTVMDVMMQAGVNPKVLIAKNGKNIRFILNDIKRVAFGTMGSNASIFINGVKKSIDEEVREGDNIELKYSINGKNAEPRVKDYIDNIYSVSFFINNIIYSLEPVLYINNKKSQLNTFIRGNDRVDIIYPRILEDYKKYFVDLEDDFIYYLNGNKLEDEYVIEEGDRIYRVPKEKSEIVVDSVKNDEEDYNEITLTANGQNIKLKGKKKYIFVDIFNHIEFDLSSSKGELYLHLNGKNAGYYDELSQGDVIEIGWK